MRTLSVIAMSRHHRRLIPLFLTSKNYATRAPSYLHAVGGRPLEYLTVGSALQLAADAAPERQVVISRHQDVRITYQQLLAKADELAAGLSSSGLQPGDRIGLLAPNCCEWIVSMMAAARAGLITVALNPVYEKPEIEYCIKKVGMKAIVTPASFHRHQYYSMLRDLAPELGTSVPGELDSATLPDLKLVVTLSEHPLPGALTFTQVCSRATSQSKKDIERLQSKIGPDEGFIIHFTSGTTGNPKAALVSHFSTVNNSYYLGKRTELDQNNTKICVQVPMFHAFGSVITFMAAMRHNATLVFPSAAYDPVANLEAIVAERCSVIHGTPTMYVDLVQAVRAGGQQTVSTGVRAIQQHSARVALTAGAPVSPHLLRQMKSVLGLDVVKSLFGMTETTAGIFQSLPGESEEKAIETVGFIHDHLETKVVDGHGQAVPFGSPGELLVRGYSTMLGYWGDEHNTRQTIGQDKWLKTGDQFVIEEDGYGKIVGRIKDMIIRGGENIYPKEIENVIDTHPDVLESQVFGVSDEHLGEEVCVAVRIRGSGNRTSSAEGASASMTHQELQKYCGGRLASFKIPRLVKIVDDFPKTTSGKIQKYKLRQMVESGKL